MRLTPTMGVPNHHYPAERIALAVFMIVHAGASLRCAAQTVAYFAEVMGGDYGRTRHATIANWTRRLLLYASTSGESHAAKKAGGKKESP